MPRSKKKLVLWAVFSLCLLLTVTVIFLWKTHRLQDWLKKRAILVYLDKLQPHLPFEIEAITVEAPWQELKKGNIKNLGLKLKWEPFRIYLKGPLKIVNEGLNKPTSFHYQPTGTIERLANPKNKSSPTQLSFIIKVSKKFTEIDTISLDLLSDNWSWDYGASIKLKKPNLQIDWKENRLLSRFTLESAEIEKAKPSTESKKESEDERDGEAGRTFNLSGLEITSKADLVLNPFKIGPELQFTWKGNSFEALIGETYIDFPIKKFPGSLNTSLDFSKEKAIPVNHLVLKLANTSVFNASYKNGIANLDWEIKNLSLTEAFNLGFTVRGGEPPEGIQLTGRLKSQGSLSIPLKSPFQDSASNHFNLTLNLDQLNFKYPKKNIAILGGQVRLNVSDSKAGHFTLSLNEIAFRRFLTQLKPLKFSIKPEFDLATGSRNFKFSAPKTSIENVELGQISGSVQLPSKGKKTKFEFNSSIDLKPSKLTTVLGNLCLPTTTVPPAMVTANFHKVYVEKGAFKLLGKTQLDLFDGYIRINDLRVFDLLSSVPETNFSAEWDGIRLDRVHEWLKFGEMDGIITGYAKDVVFQALLPTQYEARLQARPRVGDEIAFSSQAMKNLVRIFAGDDLDDALPGYVDSVAFGWMSRLLGDYDVDYAGVDLLATEGLILVKTLDPYDSRSETLEESGAREQKRFFLKGTRFKIQMHSEEYPLVLDAHAMANFVQHMVGQLEAIKKIDKGAEKKNEKPKEIFCLPEKYQ